MELKRHKCCDRILVHDELCINGSWEEIQEEIRKRNEDYYYLFFRLNPPNIKAKKS